MKLETLLDREGVTSLSRLIHAEIHARLGSPIEGLACLNEAQRFAETTDERREDAELCRLRGDLLGSAAGRGGADRCYHRAPPIPRQQSPNLLELRPPPGLPRLWRDQGRRTEAR